MVTWLWPSHQYFIGLPLPLIEIFWHGLWDSFLWNLRPCLMNSTFQCGRLDGYGSRCPTAFSNSSHKCSVELRSRKCGNHLSEISFSSCSANQSCTNTRIMGGYIISLKAVITIWINYQHNRMYLPGQQCFVQVFINMNYKDARKTFPSLAWKVLEVHLYLCFCAVSIKFSLTCLHGITEN